MYWVVLWSFWNSGILPCGPIDEQITTGITTFWIHCTQGSVVSTSKHTQTHTQIIMLEEGGCDPAAISALSKQWRSADQVIVGCEAKPFDGDGECGK
jgi:hypothetical protein